MAEETALAAALLAEKFNNQALSQTHDHIQEQILQAQTHALTPQVATTAAYPSNTTYPQATNTTSTDGDATSEPVQAYAKLEGDSFCYYIRYGFWSNKFPRESLYTTSLLNRPILHHIGHFK